MHSFGFVLLVIILLILFAGCWDREQATRQVLQEVKLATFQDPTAPAPETGDPHNHPAGDRSDDGMPAVEKLAGAAERIASPVDRSDDRADPDAAGACHNEGTGDGRHDDDHQRSHRVSGRDLGRSG